MNTTEGTSATAVGGSALSEGLGPDGKLHADGYFTWHRRDGYVLDAKLPAEFVLADKVRAALDQKHAEYEDLKRCAANNTRNQGLKIETLLRGINDARALIDPIWRHRMGAEQVREHVQRGLRCIDSAITDCQFTAPTAVHASDCAMHNAPAYPAGECDCGALGPNV